MDLTTNDIDVLHRLFALEANTPAGVADMAIVDDLLAVLHGQPAFADLADPTPELLAATEQSARRLEAAGLVETAMQPDGRMLLRSTVDGWRVVTEGT